MSILDKHFKNLVKDNLEELIKAGEFKNNLDKYIKEGKIMRDCESVFVLDTLPENINTEINLKKIRPEFLYKEPTLTKDPKKYLADFKLLNYQEEDGECVLEPLPKEFEDKFLRNIKEYFLCDKKKLILYEKLRKKGRKL